MDTLNVQACFYNRMNLLENFNKECMSLVFGHSWWTNHLILRLDRLIGRYDPTFGKPQQKTVPELSKVSNILKIP